LVCTYLNQLQKEIEAPSPETEKTTEINIFIDRYEPPSEGKANK
jgi:hypothetical protein